MSFYSSLKSGLQDKCFKCILGKEYYFIIIIIIFLKQLNPTTYGSYWFGGNYFLGDQWVLTSEWAWFYWYIFVFSLICSE